MENKTLIKPQIEYTGINQFHDSIKKYSMDALIHIAKYGGAIEDLEGINAVDIENPTLIYKVEPQIYPSIEFEDGIYTQEPDISINTNLYSNLAYNALNSIDFNHIRDIEVDKYDDESLMVKTPLIKDITDMSKLNNKRLLTDMIMENQEKSNRIIDSFYSQFGLKNTENRHIKVDLSKEINF